MRREDVVEKGIPVDHVIVRVYGNEVPSAPVRSHCVVVCKVMDHLYHHHHQPAPAAVLTICTLQLIERFRVSQQLARETPRHFGSILQGTGEKSRSTIERERERT